MLKKSLVHLSCLGLLVSLSACGTATPEETTLPTVTETVTEASTPQETSSTAPSSSTPSSSAPASQPSAAEETTASEEPENAIPAALQGKWLRLGDAQEGRDCSEIEDPAGFVEIDSTTIKFFAVINTLQSVEENDGTTFVGEFSYQGDNDSAGTSRLELEQLSDDTMEFTDLQGDTGPDKYELCQA